MTHEANAPAWLRTARTAALAALAICGCAAPASLTLRQPSAPTAEREIRLASDWAFYAQDGERREMLLAFPLPHARTGPRDFLLYLSAPADRDEVRIAAQDGGATYGFLIQEVGRMKGRTNLRSGAVSIDTPLLRRRALDVEFDVTGEDGTRIVGRARLAPDDRELRAFRDRFRADIEIARRGQPTSAPADARTAADAVAVEPRPAAGAGDGEAAAAPVPDPS